MSTFNNSESMDQIPIANQQEISLDRPPKRQLTAYNLFFQSERRKLLDSLSSPFAAAQEEHEHADEVQKRNSTTRRSGRKKNKPHGKIGFAELARTISAKWKDTTDRQVYQDLAEKDKIRYQAEMKYWKKLKREASKQQQSSAKKNKVNKKATATKKMRQQHQTTTPSKHGADEPQEQQQEHSKVLIPQPAAAIRSFSSFPIYDQQEGFSHSYAAAGDPSPVMVAATLGSRAVSSATPVSPLSTVGGDHFGFPCSSRPQPPQQEPALVDLLLQAPSIPAHEGENCKSSSLLFPQQEEDEEKHQQEGEITSSTDLVPNTATPLLFFKESSSSARFEEDQLVMDDAPLFDDDNNGSPPSSSLDALAKLMGEDGLAHFVSIFQDGNTNVVDHQGYF